MKILEIIPNLQAGGAEVFLVNLCNEMCRHNETSITLLTFYDSENSFLLNKLDPSITLAYIPKSRGFDVKLMYRLYDFIMEGEYDIAHFHVNTIAYALLPAIRNLCRCYATIHNDAYREASGIHRFIRRVLFKSKKVYPITISHQSDASFHQLYGSSISTTVIYNGVPKHTPTHGFSLKQYQTTPNTKLLIMAAALSPVKNELAVAQAVKQLVDEGEDIALVIIGRDANKQYAQQIKDMTSQRIHYIGEVSNPVDYMRHGNYFVLASYFEGLPISLLEALSVGCIPIVTPVGGCVDVVNDGRNGFIIATQEKQDIYKTIKKVLHFPDQVIMAIKEQALFDANRYTISYCANSYLSLFNRIKA